MALYDPVHPFTEPEWHTLLRQPSALSAQRKGGGISKGGNPGSPLWLRAKHACIDCRLRKNKPDTHRLPRQQYLINYRRAARVCLRTTEREKRAITRIAPCEHAPASRCLFYKNRLKLLKKFVIMIYIIVWFNLADWTLMLKSQNNFFR